MKITLVLILSSIMLASFAQDKTTRITAKNTQKETILFPSPLTNELDTAKIIIQEDDNLGVLIEKYNSTKKDLGFRVQIHSGLNRVDALKAQSELLKLYPKITSYVIYQQPNFKVRVGDFENRLSVVRFYEEMKSVFPSSFIIADEIKISTD
jgi:hypothetical protein